MTTSMKTVERTIFTKKTFRNKMGKALGAGPGKNNAALREEGNGPGNKQGFQYNVGLKGKRNRRTPVPYAVLMVCLLLTAALGFTQTKPTTPQLEEQLKMETSLLKRRDILCRLANRYKVDTPTKALLYGKEAMALLTDYPDDTVKVKVMNALSWTYTELGVYKEALSTGKQAERLALKLGDKRIIAAVTSSISNTYYCLGDYDNALRYSLKTLTLYEAVGDERSIARALLNVGNVYLLLNQYNEAYSRYSRALTKVEKLGDKKDIAHVYNCIGAYYTYRENYAKAEEHYLHCKQIMEEEGDDGGTAMALSNLALSAFRTGDHLKALQYDRKTLAIWEKRDDKINIIKALGYIARDYSKLGKHNEADKFIQRAFNLIRQNDSHESKEVIFEILSTIYEVRKDFEKALHWERQARELNIDLFTRERTKNMAHMQVMYDVGKKDKENAVLKKNNEIKQLEINRQRILLMFFIVSALLIGALALFFYGRYRHKQRTEEILRESEHKLKQLNAGKDRLFTIIAHDLGSPLSDLLLSAGHLAEHFKILDPEEIHEFIRHIHKQTANMASLLDNLLKWAMMQIGRMEKRAEWISLRSLAQSAVRQVKHSAEKKNISCLVHLADDDKAWADQNMMSTVFRNLLSNAVKYSHPGGSIHIKAKKHGDFMAVSVSDNGAGMSTEKVNNLFKVDVHESTRGTANEKGTGLGLILCKEFVQKNGGHISVESRPQEGSCFTFTLPLQAKA